MQCLKNVISVSCEILSMYCSALLSDGCPIIKAEKSIAMIPQLDIYFINDENCELC